MNQAQLVWLVAGTVALLVPITVTYVGRWLRRRRAIRAAVAWDEHVAQALDTAAPADERPAWLSKPSPDPRVVTFIDAIRNRRDKLN